jgi:hypothetical protein
MDKRIQHWFFMRDGFDTFRLDPERHSRYVFGERDQLQRDRLLEALEENAYSRDGHKAVIYGDYGRGKTHMCRNLVFEIRRRGLHFEPIYVKCGGFKKKEPFYSLFREMIFQHSSARLQRVAVEYERKAQNGEEGPLSDAVPSEDIALVMSRGLAAPNPEAVKTSMRWLGGEPKIDLAMLGGSLKRQLVDPADFGSVMKGLSHLFLCIEDRVPLYIIDEVERFENVADPDTFFTWLATIRELTEVAGIGLLFIIGAKTRDRLPALFAQEEIIRRIGMANFVELLNPGPDAIRSFILEQFQSSIRKGPLPEVQRDVVEPGALDESVPSGLLEIIDNDPLRLESYPFEPAALDHFVQQLATGEMTNKPSEAQLRIQRAALRTMRLNRRTIDIETIDAIVEEAF